MATTELSSTAFRRASKSRRGSRGSNTDRKEHISGGSTLGATTTTTPRTGASTSHGNLKPSAGVRDADRLRRIIRDAVRAQASKEEGG